jgi:hypothetical protein
VGAEGRLAAAAVEAAGVGEQTGARSGSSTGFVAAPGSARSGALLGRVRVGSLTSVWIRVDAAAQGGPSAGRARAVAAGAWAALPGDEPAHLSAPGWTGSVVLSIPWTRSVRTAARADADLRAGALLAERAMLEYRHPCGCLGLGLLGAHRVGRDGVDVIFSVDVTPPPSR